MIERILLAIITTVCIYLFLNLGGKSSKMPNANAQSYRITELVNQITSWAW